MPTERSSRFDEQVLIRSRSVVSRNVAGDTLVVPVRGKIGDLASIYSFNGTGSLIWKLLESSKSVADLIAAVQNEYEVGETQAREDVVKFVDDLVSAELVQVGQKVAEGAANMG